jgi:hypothetical protein
VPQINFLPEDDTRAVVPPTEEQYQALIRWPEQLPARRPAAPGGGGAARGVRLTARRAIPPDVGERGLESGPGRQPGRPPCRGAAAHAHAGRGALDPQQPQVPDDPLHAARADHPGGAPHEGQPG